MGGEGERDTFFAGHDPLSNALLSFGMVPVAIGLVLLFFALRLFHRVVYRMHHPALQLFASAFLANAAGNVAVSMVNGNLLGVFPVNVFFWICLGFAATLGRADAALAPPPAVRAAAEPSVVRPSLHPGVLRQCHATLRHEYNARGAAKKVSLALLAVAALLLLCALPYAAGYGDYRKTILRILIERWFDGHDTTWQDGALVPFAVGWLVWRRRQCLAEQPVRAGWMGLPLMLLALFSYFCRLTRPTVITLALPQVQFFVAGAVIWLFGWSWMRRLAFPWLILGMMWPLVFLEDRLGFPLRLISVKGIEWLASVTHLPVIAQGTALLSASKGEAVGSWMQLQVEGPCSGMNTLLCPYVHRRSVQSSHTAHESAPLVGVYAEHSAGDPGQHGAYRRADPGLPRAGQEVAVGHEQNDMTTYHLLAGLLVFVVAFLGLQAVSSWMHRWWPRKPKLLSTDVTGPEPQELKPSMP